MNPVAGTILTALAQTGANAPVMHELLRSSKNPAKESIHTNGQALLDAARARVDQIGEITDTNSVRIDFNEPTGNTYDDIMTMSKGAAYAGMQRASTINSDGSLGPYAGSHIVVNPHASHEVLAHELGHHVTDQTKFGRMVMNMRVQPKLTKALTAASMGLPFLQSSLQEGDDDLASGIAISALASSPMLINEALATKNGLAIMKDIGKPATLGQRGRLAGAYLGYAAVPILAGFAGNALGNVADDYTAIYNLGEGELPM